MMEPTEFDHPQIEKLWNDAMETCEAAGLTGDELDHMVHTLTARRLVEWLQMPMVPPGILQCALRFLKDNDISSLPVPGSAQEQLLEAMRERVPFKPKLTGSD